MARQNENASFSADKTVIQKARARANETERGNFSAYIEKLILRDLAANPVVLKKKEGV